MATDNQFSHNFIENGVASRQSPPKAIVDCSPLQPAINKNKEGKFLIISSNLQLIHYFNKLEFISSFVALKVKLMVRRPITQLVDQGIMPCKCFIQINRSLNFPNANASIICST